MRYKIVTEADRLRAVNAVRAAAAGTVVTLEKQKLTRSAAQNRLYWMWIGIIAQELGYSKDEMHEIYKERLLWPILIRDSDEFAELNSRIRAVFEAGMKLEAAELRKHVIGMLTTTKLTVQQFTEYLREIEADALRMGIPLPHPDLYGLAVE